MTPTRAAAYFGSATLLAAWLASASGIGEQSPAPASEPQPVQSTGTETLAEDVQSQAVRLQQRLSAAPAPQRPSRNPFAFAPKHFSNSLKCSFVSGRSFFVIPGTFVRAS